jgi:hypothetical protein
MYGQRVTSKLHTKCPKHPLALYSSAAALERQNEARDVHSKKKQLEGTKKESERQRSKKARQLGRELPAGDLRALLQLEGLRPTFDAKPAQSHPSLTFLALGAGGRDS